MHTYIYIYILECIDLFDDFQKCTKKYPDLFPEDGGDASMDFSNANNNNNNNNKNSNNINNSNSNSNSNSGDNSRKKPTRTTL